MVQRNLQASAFAGVTVRHVELLWLTLVLLNSDCFFSPRSFREETLTNPKMNHSR
jgi:hypothetical protein